MPDDDEVDVHARARNHWLDVHQTHLRDHDPRLRSQRRQDVQQARDTWPELNTLAPQPGGKHA